MELERELGKQLFLRGKRRITLTKEGMLLRKRAEEIVSLVEKTKAEVSAPDEGISGDLYIGGGETEGMRLIVQTAQQVQRRYPAIRFHFSSGDGYDVTDRLDPVSYTHLDVYKRQIPLCSPPWIRTACPRPV